MSVCPSGVRCPSVQRLAPILAGESQDVTNKVVPYVLGVTPGIPGAPEPRMYPRSGYFLVRNILIQ
jgi:hypothetical protein